LFLIIVVIKIDSWVCVGSISQGNSFRAHCSELPWLAGTYYASLATSFLVLLIIAVIDIAVSNNNEVTR
jgi:hypothetical protein